MYNSSLSNLVHVRFCLWVNSIGLLNDSTTYTPPKELLTTMNGMFENNQYCCYYNSVRQQNPKFKVFAGFWATEICKQGSTQNRCEKIKYSCEGFCGENFDHNILVTSNT